MIQAILIPADREEAPKLVSFDKSDLASMQRHVEGSIAALNVQRPDASLFFNDSGKLEGMPVNWPATYLLWTHNSDFLDADFLVGPVLVTGPTNGRGDITSVPDELVTLLFRTERYRVEVQTRENGPWSGSAVKFDSWVNAYEYACGLAIRWTTALHVRVVAA